MSEPRATNLRDRNIRLVSVRDGRLKTTVSMDSNLYAILLHLFNDDPTDVAVWIRDRAFSRACEQAQKSGKRSRSRFVQSEALALIRDHLENGPGVVSHPHAQGDESTLNPPSQQEDSNAEL
ncbi:hypothetical protein [Thioalkalivibrio sp. ALMg11]|uniref:hypothetical protein n=1 Tax=Thioalkalivibrio sp. ALMg11 TaxID=1158165 RepID=UPI0003745266|nr:hypothetical protein [Thioalkalivibrio sp. ALMg11]